MARDYALDVHTPVRHVANALERAGDTALSVPQIAATYSHPNTGDVSRVRQHENCSDESEVNEWLIGQALNELRRRGNNGKVQLVEDGGLWRFAYGITFDDLRYDGKKIARIVDEYERLGDPFDKMTGAFSDDVRSALSISKDDTSELRESMSENGWIDDPAFYAVQDENGVVLIGHRRIRVAKELGIEPRIRTVVCGQGDAGDIKRFQLSVLSNIGYREMTPSDRKKIVKVLAGPGHEWTQMSIAKAVGVSRQQIGKDIEALKESGGLLPSSKPYRPKGGRPPGKTPKQPPKPAKWRNPELLDAIRNENLSERELIERFGVSSGTVHSARAHVEGQNAAAQPAPISDTTDHTVHNEPVDDSTEPEQPVEPDCTCTHCPVHCNQ